MPGFFESQIPVNLILQSLGSWLTPLMKMITLLGQEDFFIIAIVVYYWVIDRRIGMRVAVLYLVSSGLNSIIKLAFHAPRPFWIDTSVQAMADEPSFGFPSGHTQNAATTWGGFFLPMKKWWAVAAFSLVVLLVAVSRFYLGMHFVVDAVGGLVFALVTIAVYLKMEPKIDAWISGRPLNQLLIASLLCSLAFILVFGVVYLSLGGWQVPVEWERNALLGWPENPIHPLSIRNLIKSAGTILGLLAGAAWMAAKYPAYSIQGTRAQKWQRSALGLAGVLVIYAGLGMVISKESAFIPLTLTYIRFALVGLWVTGVAPFLFIKTRLAKAFSG